MAMQRKMPQPMHACWCTDAFHPLLRPSVHRALRKMPLHACTQLQRTGDCKRITTGLTPNTLADLAGSMHTMQRGHCRDGPDPFLRPSVHNV
eukprot:scaffold184037_cov15-Tisochrysis_lutea.AAC.1